MNYSIHNPDIIDELTLLTGSKETAISLHSLAMHVYNTIKSETFNVQFYKGEWTVIVDDISAKMNKHFNEEQ